MIKKIPTKQATGFTHWILKWHSEDNHRLGCWHAILSRIPANRWGDPDDFKGVTVFLASRASDYVNGTIVVVDGGWMGR